MPAPEIDPDARRRRLTGLINTASLNRTTPTLYVIEDAHWIDDVQRLDAGRFHLGHPAHPVAGDHHPTGPNTAERSPGYPVPRRLPLPRWMIRKTRFVDCRAARARSLDRRIGRPHHQPCRGQSGFLWRRSCVTSPNAGVIGRAVVADTSGTETSSTSPCLRLCRPVITGARSTALKHDRPRRSLNGRPPRSAHAFRADLLARLVDRQRTCPPWSTPTLNRPGHVHPARRIRLPPPP